MFETESGWHPLPRCPSAQRDAVPGIMLSLFSWTRQCFLWWMGLGPFLPLRPHTPAKTPEISNALWYRHIPWERKSLKSCGRKVVFEEWVVGPNPVVGFQQHSEICCPLVHAQKVTKDFWWEMLALDNPELFLSFEKLKKNHDGSQSLGFSTRTWASLLKIRCSTPLGGLVLGPYRMTAWASSMKGKWQI